MTALARQPLQIERVFQMLVRIAYLNLADMERRLERTTNAVDHRQGRGPLMIRVTPPRERLHAFSTAQRRADDRCLFCDRTARECVEQADPTDRLAPERCDGVRPYPAINSFYLL